MVLKFILKIILNKKIKVILVSKKSYDFYKNIIRGCKYKIIPNGVVAKKKLKKIILKKKLTLVQLAISILKKTLN